MGTQTTEKMAAEYVAHVKQQIDGSWNTHLLEEHLNAVADLAGKFDTHSVSNVFLMLGRIY